MAYDFFSQPILNSPYDYPSKHWQLDADGQPTQDVVENRRRAEFITPIPKPKSKKGPSAKDQKLLALDTSGQDLSDEKQNYAHAEVINRVRELVDKWREIPDPHSWGVTPQTQRLLQHWRHHDFQSLRPFFCQVEAVETIIWITEVAPNSGKAGEDILAYLKGANEPEGVDPETVLNRLALKLATGAGKTTVMAMIIAWQTINAVHSQSEKYSKGFLIVAPGLTIKDRLRVLLPNDPENYYTTRELVPAEFYGDMERAQVVVTNYHAFKQREKIEASKNTKGLIQGRGEEFKTKQTEGEVLRSVLGNLMSMKRIMVLNDEAHHCYRGKTSTNDKDDFGDLKGSDLQEAKEEAKKNNEAARLWISGLEMIQRNGIKINRVVDLSATPFFLRGSGYNEGTLFNWTMSDFSLMDAIESGIVKLPRVPVADNLPDEMPKFRVLWEHIGKDMPKKGRSAGQVLDPEDLPRLFKDALDALYGHYRKIFETWAEAGIGVPPCFIVVCNNTATSKLVYDFISGYRFEDSDGESRFRQGKLDLFSNFDEHGNPLPRPNTILIDSNQLESGEALDAEFRKHAQVEINQFKKEIIERTGDHQAADKISESDLLREVMNTVGKKGKLGEQIRCVVSVSMLTEGWDANTVTHILGVRAFGTQLLCEQVIGRALRRQSYEINEDNRFNVEYADVFGIPFDFTAKPQIVKPTKPRQTIYVHALKKRESAEITFPRVLGYRVELPEEKLKADFTEDSRMQLNPQIIGPTENENRGFIGESAHFDVEHLGNVRYSTIVLELTHHLLKTKWREHGAEPSYHLFGHLKPIARRWLDEYLTCVGGTQKAQILYKDLAEQACDRITNAITRRFVGTHPIKILLDPYNPVGSTRFVGFNTSKEDRWETNSKCHVNYCILDSGWEGEFCRVIENYPRTVSYVKNHNLEFVVPYKVGQTARRYFPDFIVRIDDGNGPDDLLNLVVEVKGFQDNESSYKRDVMNTYWIPGVNNARQFGRWAFIELSDVWSFEKNVEAAIEASLEKAIAPLLTDTSEVR